MSVDKQNDTYIYIYIYIYIYVCQIIISMSQLLYNSIFLHRQSKNKDHMYNHVLSTSFIIFVRMSIFNLAFFI